jgi:GMP synthase-like glutamine amidotransferase
MTVRVTFLEHSAWDQPGMLGERAGGLGFSVRSARADRGAAALPALDTFDVLVVLGSSASTTDDTVGWIHPERQLVAEVVDRGIPVLGICFGAQLLAQVLGGSVTRARQPEIGWLTVSTSDPDAVPAGPWVVWHEDAILAPPGSLQVARSDVCLHAFVHGVHTGVQFHPEVTGEIVAGWILDARSDGSVTTAQSVDLEAGFATDSLSTWEATCQLFDAFIERAGILV